MNSIILNGEAMDRRLAGLPTDNRGYRYGDGLFETMLVVNNRLVHGNLHMDRLFQSLDILRFSVPPAFTPAAITEQVLQLCRLNQCGSPARARLSVSRGNGSLRPANAGMQWLIECTAADPSLARLNPYGYTVDIYPDARKNTDAFSALKTASFLPYVMASLFAEENQLDEAFLLNCNDRIADGTISNIFLVQSGTIITPPLTEGGINGVMRKYLLNHLHAAGYTVQETPLGPEDLLRGDELWLTNAINGLRWVSRYRDKTYGHILADEVHRKFIQTLFIPDCSKGE